MCVPGMCRLAVVQLTTQEWGPLGTAEAQYGVCLDHGCHNFAKMSQCAQMFVSLYLFLFYFY